MRFLLIHHSHTDIGYTDPQYVIEDAHVDFIHQAMDICDSLAEAKHPFRWTCETFWAVERFWRQADPDQQERFVRNIKQGLIGISASYLNVNELIDQGLMTRLAQRAADFGKQIGFPIRSAMTADINGYNWGFANALLDADINSLFSNVHAHHGRHPLQHAQQGFNWQTHDGRKLFVWSGEHYQLGNELGMVPNAAGSILFEDGKSEDEVKGDNWSLALERIPVYLDRLKARNYNLDFVPMMVHGLRTDNAPPSRSIIDFINRWNNSHANIATMEMVTLDQFFDIARQSNHDFPTHRGDWPDWWSEGSGSYPKIVRICRDAQRELDRAEALTKAFPDAKGLTDTEREAIDDNLALAVEHTYSHSESMTQPWLSGVHEIEAKKAAYAIDALYAVRRATDRIAATWGADHRNANEVTGHHRKFTLINPFDEPWQGPVRLTLYNHDPFVAVHGEHAAVIDAHNPDIPLPHESFDIARGKAWDIWLNLNPHEIKTIKLTPSHIPSHATTPHNPQTTTNPNHLTTPSLHLTWDDNGTITAMTDQTAGQSLIEPNPDHRPFSLIRQLTPATAPDEIYSSRNTMLRDRRGTNVQTSLSQVTQILPLRTGPVSNTVTFRIACDGLGFAELELRAFHNAPRLDATYRLQKDCIWQAENLFISTPFDVHGQSQLWLDRAGTPVRPWIDQLPGTMTDYFALQSGWLRTNGTRGIALHMPDNHLLHVGPLQPGQRKLMGDPQLQSMQPKPYVWLLNNYWETNFATSPSGFYEFRFTLTWGPQLTNPTTTFKTQQKTHPGPLITSTTSC